MQQRHPAVLNALMWQFIVKRGNVDDPDIFSSLLRTFIKGDILCSFSGLSFYFGLLLEHV